MALRALVACIALLPTIASAQTTSPLSIRITPAAISLGVSQNVHLKAEIVGGSGWVEIDDPASTCLHQRWESQIAPADGIVLWPGYTTLTIRGQKPGSCVFGFYVKGQAKVKASVRVTVR
jgi:hypothetical protein